MKSATIRRLFLDYFVAQGHREVPSSSLVPADDPTLLFTNAGMVQFKRIFLGQERRDYARATTCQKCVRAGGKHNDLEQVGHTTRHHTFFEMLGNFSFGDYFKRDAIALRLGVRHRRRATSASTPTRLRVTVHHTRRRGARALARGRRAAGRPDLRPGRQGQLLADGRHRALWAVLGDLRGPGRGDRRKGGKGTGKKKRQVMSQEEFEQLAEAGRFLEIWNLVFMQFDRSADGTLTPLPKPSVDTGAGLERIAAVMQRVDNNFHTDLFLPLLDRAGRAGGAALRSRGRPAPPTGCWPTTRAR